MPAEFGNSIKQGFRVVNRNWQIVLARVAGSLVNWLALFIIVGIPLFIAVMVVGVELATSSAMAFLNGLKEAFMSGYFGIALMVLTSVLLYLMVIALVWVYVISGCMGIIAVSAVKDGRKVFTGRLFFAAAKEHLRRLTGFYALLGLFVIAASILAGIAVGGTIYISDALKESSTFLGVLLGMVLYIFITVFVVASVLGGLSIGAFGAAATVLEKKDAWASLKTAITFLYRNPGAFFGFSLLFLLYGIITFIILAPLNLFFLIGVFLAFPYMIVTYAAEYYLGLCLIASAFSYYFKKTGAGISEGIQQKDIRADAMPGQTPG
ncbi:MAG: hypothetical protein M0Z52_03020 [Actinomycetota bacterium]|nr:hypothetical protein [Actinomycetota bacterium]